MTDTSMMVSLTAFTGLSIESGVGMTIQIGRKPASAVMNVSAGADVAFSLKATTGVFPAGTTGELVFEPGSPSLTASAANNGVVTFRLDDATTASLTDGQIFRVFLHIPQLDWEDDILLLKGKVKRND